MGAMKRVARFFSRSIAGAPEKVTSAYWRSSPTQFVTVDEKEWRQAPEKYQRLVQKGQAFKIVDSRGSVVASLESRTVAQDANGEKEMQDLLSRCQSNGTALSGSWLE